MPPPAPRKRAAPDAPEEPAPATKRVLNADGTTVTVKADPEALDGDVDEWGFTTGPAQRELQMELDQEDAEDNDEKKPRLRVSYSGFKM